MDVVKFGVRVLFQHVDIENNPDTPVSSEQGSCRYTVCMDVCVCVPVYPSFAWVLGI